MVDVINMFLSIFSGVVGGFVDLSVGGFRLLDIVYGGFIIGLAISLVARVIGR